MSCQLNGFFAGHAESQRTPDEVVLCSWTELLTSVNVHSSFLTADILTCHSQKGTAVTNNVNAGSIIFNFLGSTTPEPRNRGSSTSQDWWLYRVKRESTINQPPARWKLSVLGQFSPSPRPIDAFFYQNLTPKRLKTPVKLFCCPAALHFLLLGRRACNARAGTLALFDINTQLIFTNCVCSLLKLVWICWALHFLLLQL